MMQTDVKAVKRTTDGAFFTGGTRLRGLVVTPASTGDGGFAVTNGNGGPIVFDVNTINAQNTFNVVIPGEGIWCPNGIYLYGKTNVVCVVAFYG